MRYLTDRKRATGTGASRSGTHHHWAMQLSSVALAGMVPVWVFIFGRALGQSRDVVVETFSRPFPAILTVLLLVVAMRHFIMGASMMVEDYTKGFARKAAIFIIHALGWGIGATGIFAIARMAF